MPEYLASLVYILFFSVFVLWSSRKTAAEGGMSQVDYRKSGALWITITLLLFFSHDYWLFVTLCGLILFASRRSTASVLALYFFVLFASPQLANVIPGPGRIESIFVIDYYRLLNLMVLFPYFLKLRKATPRASGGMNLTDVLVAALLAWMFAVQALASLSATDAIRSGFYLLLDIALPYYVASRGVKSSEEFREIAVSYVVSCAIVGVLAMVESSRQWLLYTSLGPVIGVSANFMFYVRRGDGGTVRAIASLGHAIPLGFVLAVGFAMLGVIYPLIRSAWRRYFYVIAFIGGLAASLSRGPWIGAFVTVLILYALAPGLGKRMVGGIFTGTIIMVVLLVSPVGDAIVSYLPFIGTVETGTIDYRARLFEVSMEVFNQNRWTGDFNYLRNPLLEQMRQGEGIIDIVNTYLQFALPYGMIGVALFVSVFLSTLFRVVRVRNRRAKHPDAERLGRVLIAAVVGVLVTIATTSSVSVIPTVYWLLLGLCISYSKMFGEVLVRTDASISSVGTVAVQSRL